MRDSPGRIWSLDVILDNLFNNVFLTICNFSVSRDYFFPPLRVNYSKIFPLIPLRSEPVTYTPLCKHWAQPQNLILNSSIHSLQESLDWCLELLV